MLRKIFACLLFCGLLSSAWPQSTSTPEPTEEEPPEGYYAFVESPNATPPRVRPPPYRQTPTECPSLSDLRPHVSANNLCGDLNRGLIPKNPLGQSVNGEPYPFELIRNATLRFLSRALPVLRGDDTLPRVTHLPGQPNMPTGQPNMPTGQPNLPTGQPNLPTGQPNLPIDQPGQMYGQPAQPIENINQNSFDYGLHQDHNRLAARHRRATEQKEKSEQRSEGRDTRFCENGGVFCMLYRAINGESSANTVERREDPGQPHRYEGPPTPCPARVEYATPVFARNFQGVWRYVVQIPYEGYFTQTIELTRCMSGRCHYLEGGCLSSPRWVSLLVAELHYPPSATTNNTPEYNQQFLEKRAGVNPEEKPHCDGHDDMGCYQVRLYYDWFLVPGSCKCWRPDYFARYVRRRHSADGEL